MLTRNEIVSYFLMAIFIATFFYFLFTKFLKKSNISTSNEWLFQLLIAVNTLLIGKSIKIYFSNLPIKIKYEKIGDFSFFISFIVIVSFFVCGVMNFYKLIKTNKKI
ncbi:MAG TPA: hypothetical protein DC049_03050 [Spirochaetia bacterium]|nr:hypothetical protein [Spirochaetia bacterium]